MKAKLKWWHFCIYWISKRQIFRFLCLESLKTPTPIHSGLDPIDFILYLFLILFHTWPSEFGWELTKIDTATSVNSNIVENRSIEEKKSKVNLGNCNERQKYFLIQGLDQGLVASLLSMRGDLRGWGLGNIQETEDETLVWIEPFKTLLSASCFL